MIKKFQIYIRTDIRFIESQVSLTMYTLRYEF
jgi:hypothetical protein